ncbi:MAG: hao2 [Modestobacter sp.]|jgi:4-hydroxymandelate oxidase|nr:hao2 [Modestobacter sp.]
MASANSAAERPPPTTHRWTTPLGANAVFLGRPAVWGLATGGADGVAGMITGLTEELAHTMVLCGLPDVGSVLRDTVVPAR